MKDFGDFICGLACLGMIWGLVWGIFIRGWVWLSVGSMVVGLLYCFFTED